MDKSVLAIGYLSGWVDVQPWEIVEMLALFAVESVGSIGPVCDKNVISIVLVMFIESQLLPSYLDVIIHILLNFLLPQSVAGIHVLFTGWLDVSLKGKVPPGAVLTEMAFGQLRPISLLPHGLQTLGLGIIGSQIGLVVVCDAGSAFAVLGVDEEQSKPE